MCKETIKEFILQLTEADVTSANAQKPKRFSEKQTVVREEEPEKHFLTACVYAGDIFLKCPQRPSGVCSPSLLVDRQLKKYLAKSLKDEPANGRIGVRNTPNCRQIYSVY